jgi:MoaA/NifB/PqqE/SkfB family radical SAM enzyme
VTNSLLPERLNLAIARRCPVACKGCYTYFGKREPLLARLLSSAVAFIALGINQVTVSGGDPLTIFGLTAFLQTLRRVGMISVKLDTVGVGLAAGVGGQLDELLNTVDLLGIPLDGWSGDSVSAFRHGRPSLYTETIELLGALDRTDGGRKVIINTVAHRANIDGLPLIEAAIRRHDCVIQWNIFQYTPTDQASASANHQFQLAAGAFAAARDEWLARWVKECGTGGPIIAFRDTRSRLGRYLLINSDGEAWLPDEMGTTVRLGSVFGREPAVLAQWSALAQTLRAPACGRESAVRGELHSREVNAVHQLCS